MSYMTVTETADRLGVSRQAVLKAINSGSLPSRAEVERGRVVRYLVAAEGVSARIAAQSRPTGFLSVSEVAARLDAGTSSVCRWIASGRLPATKVGGSHLIDPSDIVAFASPGRTGSERGSVDSTESFGCQVVGPTSVE